MPVYLYTALDSHSSKSLEGRLEADNFRAAKEMIRNQGQIPIRLELERQDISFGGILDRIPVLRDLKNRPAGMKELNLITQQLYTLINAGIPLIESLFLLEQQTEHRILKATLRKVRADVIAGDSFSDALAKFPQQFPKLYVNMMRSGELSGELETVCSRLCFLLEKTMALQAKIQGAMVYPAVTILVIIGVILLIMIAVVPQFQGLFSSFNKALPLPTEILILCSHFVLSFWWAMLIAVASSAFWFNTFRLGKGKELVDQWVLTIPVLGDLLRKVYVSRFIRTLATVIGAGVSLTEGLVTAAATVDNLVLHVAFDKARESLLQGGTLARPLEQTHTMPIMVVKMIAIAEETGRMEEMLNKAADFLDIEVDRAVATLTTLIEPLMIVVLGSILLGVALALYIPLFNMSNVING